MIRVSIRNLIALMVLVVAGVACSEEAEIVYQLNVVSGNNQSGIQSSVLNEPIIIRVTDEHGDIQKGVELNAIVYEGDGSIESLERVTNDNGLVHITWRLGEDFTHRMRVSVKESSLVNLEINASTNYRYNTPPEDQDGWEVGNLDFLRKPSQELIFNGIDRLRAGLYPEVHSVVVMHNKKLVLEEYYSGSNSSGVLIDWNRFSLHEIQSASKSFRSMLVGIAIEKGVIDGVDVPFFSFFPNDSDLNNEDMKGDITLDHVLTMSAGFDWEEWAFPFGHTKNNLSTMYAKPANQWVRYVLGLPMRDVPGSRFAYSTGTSLMLANVISNSLNTSLRNFTKQYYSDLVEGTSTNNPNGVTMTSRQMAKLGYIYLYDGKWKENQIVSPEWIAKSIEPGFQNINSSGSYGYQWWLKSFSTSTKSYDCYYASGNGGQFIVVNKELDLVVVFTGGNFGSSKMFDILSWMEDHVFEAFE